MHRIIYAEVGHITCTRCCTNAAAAVCVLACILYLSLLVCTTSSATSCWPLTMQTIRYLSMRCACVCLCVCVCVRATKPKTFLPNGGAIEWHTADSFCALLVFSAQSTHIFVFRKLFCSLLLFAMCVIFARVSALCKRARNFQGIFPLLTFVCECECVWAK